MLRMGKDSLPKYASQNFRQISQFQFLLCVAIDLNVWTKKVLCLQKQPLPSVQLVGLKDSKPKNRGEAQQEKVKDSVIPGSGTYMHPLISLIGQY